MMSREGRALAHGDGLALLDVDGHLVLEATEPSARGVLDDVESLHSEPPHPRLPSANRQGDRLVFELAPLGTLAQVLVRARKERASLDYMQALGLGAVTAEVFAAIRERDPARCSGRLTGNQVVLDLDGEAAYVGLGTALFLDANAEGEPSPFVGIAPEVMRGSAPSPSSHVYAAAELATTIAPFLEFPPALGEALGRAEPSAIAEAARYFDAKVRTHVVADRESDLAAVIRQHEEAWRGTGLTFSPEEATAALARIAVTLLSPTLLRLEVAEDGSTLRRALGATEDLSARDAPRRLLVALVADRLADGPGLDFDAMTAAGWPGERIFPKAARARVHVAVSTLRKLGLGDWLVHRDGRYAIDARVRVARPT